MFLLGNRRLYAHKLRIYVSIILFLYPFLSLFENNSNYLYNLSNAEISINSAYVYRQHTYLVPMSQTLTIVRDFTWAFHFGCTLLLLIQISD